jgi:hypothetical protein
MKSSRKSALSPFRNSKRNAAKILGEPFKALCRASSLLTVTLTPSDLNKPLMFVLFILVLVSDIAFASLAGDPSAHATSNKVSDVICCEICS